MLVRPSYVLGGRGMVIVYDDDSLVTYVEQATEASPDHPILIDRFLDDAIEIDVDALFDGEDMYLGGIMEHVEEAGIHSGDSCCTLPPATLGDGELERVRVATRKLAEGIGVRGLMNVQFALAQDILYVIEANPRALAHRAVRRQGDGRADRRARRPGSCSAPRSRSCARRACCPRPATAADARPRPDLVQGGGAALQALPHQGGRRRRLAARARDALDRRGHGHRRRLRLGVLQGPAGRRLGAAALGRDLRLGRQPRQARHALPGQAPRRPRLHDPRDERHGGGAQAQRHRGDGRPQDHRARRHAPGEKSIVDLILDGTVQMVVNTPSGQDARADGYAIRAATTSADKPIITTIATLAAAVLGIEAQLTEEIRVKSLQDHARDLDLYGRARRGGRGGAR